MDLKDYYLLGALLACVWLDPSIAQELIYPIREELQENVLIGNIPKDLNISHMNAATGASANLVYRLVSKAGDNPLVRVLSSTGEIFTTSNRIDREKLCPGPSFEDSECSFEIEVVILPNDYFRLIKIKIIVKDTNDNAPMFPSPVINISIPENTLINSRFAIPSATDPDTGPNSVHKYELINGQSAFGLDIVETPEGEKWPQLIVQQNLDREQKDTYVMKIKVEDGGSPQKSSTAILQVTVTDVNDNRPVFKEGQIEVHIPENSPIGTSVVQLQATDADIGANAEIRYVFGTQVSPATKRLFALNTTSGLITVQRPLDREETAIHKLSVLASDGSSSPARATVTINVTDVNDNPPNIDLRYIISPINGTVFLSEKDPINTKIALITVSDKDTDINGKVICFIEKDVPFHLKAVYDNQYLLETSALLDYEGTKEYNFKIVASDSGKPSLNQTALVRVRLEDENDNPPIFTQPVIELAVMENNKRDLFLTTLSATDEDSGKNAEIVYQLGPNASFFDLDRKTGVLTASRVFDREDQDRFLFTFFVSENLPKYSTVGVITVTDSDAGENAAVSLSILNDNENFILDPYSGVIKSNVSFDREQQSSYTFDVRAVDSGRPPCSSAAKVTINVIDVNDNTPIVIYPPSNTSFKLVPLSSIPGSVVAEVFAVDGDTGMNAELKYTIVSGNNKGLFRIDPVTGNITLEEKPAVTDIGLHRLVVNISDLGYPKSLHTLVLVFLYVNDTVGNSTLIYDLIRRTMETPIDRNIGESSETYQSGDYLTIMIAFVTGALVVIIVIFVTVLLRCRHASRFKAAQRKKQGAEWMSPNTENKQNKKKKRKKRKSPKSSLLNFVTIEGNKPDDPAHEPINGTISLPTELEEQGIGRFDWNATPTTTFKPSSPDLARHYKSASPQSAFHLKADTPRSSTSSDHFSASECSSQGGFKTKGPMHTRQQPKILQDSSISTLQCKLGASPLSVPDILNVVLCEKGGTLTRARTELNPEYLDLRPRAELNPEYWTPCTPLSTVPLLEHRCSIHDEKHYSNFMLRKHGMSLKEIKHDFFGLLSNGGQPTNADHHFSEGTRSQRRVTFHLPDGSQESCSDSGLGDHEPVGSGSLLTQPLPLVQAQDDFYEQASPDKRTEADGNSDPNSGSPLGFTSVSLGQGFDQVSGH
ncbi:hypothetical protein L3Q82_008691 [Scortum barcoo]|uniref:Uncharacterized protein n=1 Tax=Scortum barcoo TaxID=214431 RepID=A0ACB8XB20_9TELE|nr:hypothetical protein L3Q82_008691 [Scortum barcoo]